jgi:uncharacterized protein with HEPN domain
MRGEDQIRLRHIDTDIVWQTITTELPALLPLLRDLLAKA